MATSDTLHAKCHGCGYEAPAGGDVWETVDHPPLGSVRRCPECGSTRVHSSRA